MNCKECGKRLRTMKPTNAFINVFDGYKKGNRGGFNLDNPLERKFAGLDLKSMEINICRNPLCPKESKAKSDEWWS